MVTVARHGQLSVLSLTMREIEIPARSNNATRKVENIKVCDKGLEKDKKISSVL
jgi:hypothetical protein